LVAILVSALLVGPIALLKQIDPDGPWQLMPLLALLVATESVITRRWLDWPVRKRNRTIYSLAELIVLLALAPLFLWLASGRSPVSATAVELLANPLALLSVPLLAYTVLVIVAWERAHTWSGTLVKLSVSHHELRYYSSSPSQRASDPSIVSPAKNRAALLHSLVQSWIFGGIFLTVMVALATLDIGSGATLDTLWPPLARLGLNQELLAALLVYFLGGLWLVSQGRGAALRGRWLADGSQSDGDVTEKWRRWALLLILGLALIASLLPIGPTVPLLQILQVLGRFVITVFNFVAAILALLLFLIVSLLPGSEAQPDQPTVDLNQLTQMQQNPPPTPVTIPNALAGSFIWLLVIGIVVAATLYFVRGRAPYTSLDRLRVIWHSLVAWLHSIGHRSMATATNLTNSLRLSLRRPAIRGNLPSPIGYIRVGALPPREQIRFLYLSLVRQAGKRGLSRPKASTPAEFLQSLKSSWPDAGDDLEALTDSFHKARYEPHEIDKQLLRSAKVAWRNIRRHFSQRGAHDSGKDRDGGPLPPTS
jgi:hypothetical protein